MTDLFADPGFSKSRTGENPGSTWKSTGRSPTEPAPAVLLPTPYGVWGGKKNPGCGGGTRGTGQAHPERTPGGNWWGGSSRAELEAELAETLGQIDQLQPIVDRLQVARDEAREALADRLFVHQHNKLDYPTELLPYYEHLRFASFDLYRPKRALAALRDWRLVVLDRLRVVNLQLERKSRFVARARAA